MYARDKIVLPTIGATLLFLSRKFMVPRLRQLLLWCAVLHVATADWSIGDAGMDHRFGIDANNVTIPSNSSVDCAAACEAASPVCQAWVFTPSGSCGGEVAVCMFKALPGPPTPNTCRESGFPRTASLLPPAFNTLPLGYIVPEGWLADELTVMANGLTGYLAAFWHDIMNSSFVGGGGDPGLHEKVPYWLNGLVPLSYLLPGQPRLAAQRQHYLEYIMEHQAPSGWLGPDDAPTDGQQVCRGGTCCKPPCAPPLPLPSPSPPPPPPPPPKQMEGISTFFSEGRERFEAGPRRGRTRDVL